MASLRYREVLRVGTPVTDDDVMIDVQAGRPAAFEVLYGHSARAHGVARPVCRDDGRAQEAAQDAFGSIWRARRAYPSEVGNVAPWLLTLVRSRAVDGARRNAPHGARNASDEHLARLAIRLGAVKGRGRLGLDRLRGEAHRVVA
jgi:DNA-directed RNA polymerase specialized sigma24 family protein